jgi:ABC-2 type transport system permease protein
MLGKIIPYLLVSFVNVIALLVLGQYIFGVSVAGNYLELVLLSLVFIIGSLGMGVLISNVSQSQMQAMYIAVFVVIIPAVILSGLMFPRDNMPAVTYWFGAMLPVTHYLEITRGIMLRGIGSEYLWGSIIPMLILSVVYFAASVLVFKKRI